MEQGPLSLLCTGKEPVDHERDTVRGAEHIARTMDQRAVVGGLPGSPHSATDSDRWNNYRWV